MPCHPNLYLAQNSLTVHHRKSFYHVSVELANKIAGSLVDKSTYQIWFDKCNCESYHQMKDVQ